MVFKDLQQRHEADTCGAREVVHDLVGELDAVLLPVEGGVVVQLATRVLGERAYGRQIRVFAAAPSHV